MSDRPSTITRRSRSPSPMAASRRRISSQSRDFAAAVKAAGKPVELLEAANFSHFEMCESLGNPYGPNGLAALKLMKLA